jgi:hypothetical protein
MSLLIIEGPRRAGKTYLIAQQKTLPIFKFDFNTNFSYWDFDKNSKDIHWFGLGKEIMLHELNLSGFLPKMIVDRGILTNSVWGVFQKRITEEQAKKDLVNFHKRGLFKDTKILLIEGQWKGKRTKDIWDEDDYRGEEENALFLSFSELLLDLGVEVQSFHNNFDLESVISFKMKINNL